MSLNDVVMLLRLFSVRLNGSYDELGVSCGGVVDDVFVVCGYLIPFGAGHLVNSNVLFRALTNRNSLSISVVRPASMCSSDSSHIGNSASICCLRIFNT